MRINGILAKATLVLSLATIHPTAASADVFCSYQVANLWLSSEGWVNVAFTSALGNKNWWLCQQGANTNVNDGYAARVVNPANCAAVYSQLLTAQM
jgi:hypothetical protein